MKYFFNQAARFMGTNYTEQVEKLNERNIKVEKALPSDPVQILGFDQVPNAGEEFIVMSEMSEAREVAQKRAQLICKHKRENL